MTAKMIRIFRKGNLRPSRFAFRPGFFITVCGAWTLVAVVALILIAINYGNNLVFATAFLVLAVLLQAGWDNRRMLSGVRAVLTPPAAVFAGDRARIEAELSFTTLRARAGLRLVLNGGDSGDGRDGGNSGGGQDESETSGIDSERRQRTAHLALDWQAEGRGWKTLAPIALASHAPLGLWRSRRPLDPIRILVYPRPGGVSLPPKNTRHPAHGAPQAESFAGVREYAPGDSPTRINWRIYGRREELATNVFDGGAGQHARHLAWDDAQGNSGNNGNSENIEARLSQLARWILEADGEGEEYGLEIPGRTITPDCGPKHRDACLTALALFGNDNGNNVDDGKEETGKQS